METGAVIAVTLQEADAGDTERETTVKETLAEAGTAVAELIEREAETRPAEPPQVHLGGIEEIVADKGYHSGPGATRDEGRRRADVYSREKASREAALGGEEKTSGTLCTRTVNGYSDRRASVSCASVGS